jgi:FkbM family methyltransferase
MSGRPIARDDHGETITHFLEILSERHELGTVVHIGAHTGEEVDAYRAHGAARIVLVEANPDTAMALVERFHGVSDIEVVHAAVTDHEGREQLLLHTNARGGTESASLLAMRRLGEIVPTLRTERAVDVPATTLDALLERLDIAPAAVGLLVIDVQGAELHVLRGAARSLPRVAALLVEVALIDLYAGAALETEVEELVLGGGLRPLDALYYELYEGEHRFPAWGDRLFVR